MDKSNEKSELTVIENVIGRSLTKTYGQLSRRSFLSMMTRKVLTLAGVGVAAQMFPYFAPEAEAQQQPFGPMCGLRGWICGPGSNCYGGSVGAKWSKCCQIPVYSPSGPCPPVYAACSYTDYCSTELPPNHGEGCAGVDPSGYAWCGPAGGLYICTVPACGMTYQQEQQCMNAIALDPRC